MEFRRQLVADIGRPNPVRPHQLLDVDHRTRPAQLDRDDEPATGLPGVGWPARCVLVHVSDRVLRNWIAPLRGLQVQPHRMILVDRHGFSILLNHARVGLAERIAGGGRFLGIWLKRTDDRSASPSRLLTSGRGSSSPRRRPWRLCARISPYLRIVRCRGDACLRKESRARMSPTADQERRNMNSGQGLSDLAASGLNRAGSAHAKLVAEIGASPATTITAKADCMRAAHGSRRSAESSCIVLSGRSGIAPCRNTTEAPRLLFNLR